MHKRLYLAAIAAAVALAGTAPLTAQADPPPWSHAGGNHRGWQNGQGQNRQYTGYQSNGTLYGVVTQCYGSGGQVRLNNGQIVNVNFQNAGNQNLSNGQTIVLRGGWGNDGVFYANSVQVANNGYNYPGQYQNGQYNGGWQGRHYDPNGSYNGQNVQYQNGQAGYYDPNGKWHKAKHRDRDDRRDRDHDGD